MNLNQLSKNLDILYEIYKTKKDEITNILCSLQIELDGNNLLDKNNRCVIEKRKIIMSEMIFNLELLKNECNILMDGSNEIYNYVCTYNI